ncbi:MAG: DEAD/DEAH box helicase family protein [Nanoarchaeota archaeon]|nr:DEAD/DEAH box helicase family protein [Nanoarchaeota archaeon]MBU1622191.1 DEAD/DEAH box helicase family protein [Nanoarchaeota archaeon]MBU1974724.1 DEAD/DEAH box helicase family protein [Nanoarchaeota archaeon]
MGKKEAKARIKINKLLEESGWRFFDTKSKSANIVLEQNVKITENHFEELGEDFEKTKNGYTDFTLLDEHGFPIAVLEAKCEDKHPLVAKEQARTYAKSLNVRYVILSNGNIHYFWDLNIGNPQIITKFPTSESLGTRKKYEPNKNNLIKERVDSEYIAISQKPDYASDPDYNNEKKRSSFIEKTGLRFFRPYQLNAIKSIQKAVLEGQDRFLFEMATGTGKTLISAGVIKLFLRTKNAKRVLFLVDRLELEDQAYKNFKKYLSNDFKTVIFKENRDDWKKADIIVSTIQTFMRFNKYKDIFSPTDFDLVISDEAHRSIGGNSRAVFEFFLGYKLGLTATPKDYLKHVDMTKLLGDDPRKLERRELLDTYKTFGCEHSEPTYRYSLIDGVNDGFLINPIVADGRTEITTELLSEKGYSILVKNEDGEKEEQVFFHKQFERKFFSEKTNKSFCKAFIENALRDPISGEIGKSIIFCVSQIHAAKIANILNEFAMKAFPNKYNSDFAVQVSSDIENAQQMPINFANNNLLGHTKFLEGYKSSRARVCVTVGMMTTGYDCQDLLNIGLLRPIFSPTDFIQIKGRGTRKFNFTYKVKDEVEGWIEKSIEKEKFKLFDFFGNCEYFEKDFPYDEKIKLPAITKTYVDDGREKPMVIRDGYENYNLDEIKTYAETDIGKDGMRIDRELFDSFADTVKADNFINKKFKEGRLEEAEEYVRKELFNKPEEYINLDKLRKAVKLDRRLTLREVLEKIFGKLKKFKKKDEILEEEISKFVELHGTDRDNLQECIHTIRLFMKEYIANATFRKIIDSGNFTELETNPVFSMHDLEELNGWREDLVNYVKDYVNLNVFMEVA